MNPSTIILKLLQQPPVQNRIKAAENKYCHNIGFNSYYYDESSQEYTIGFHYQWLNTDEGDDGSLMSWEEQADDDLVFKTEYSALSEETLNPEWVNLLINHLEQKANRIEEEWNQNNGFYYE